MSDLTKWHEKMFLYTLYASWILYPVSFFIENKYGLVNLIDLVDLAVKLYISLVLIYKFNPWFGCSQKFSKFDTRLAWQAGFFLFISSLSVTVINNIKQNLVLPIKNYIVN